MALFPIVKVPYFYLPHTHNEKKLSNSNVDNFHTPRYSYFFLNFVTMSISLGSGSSGT